MVKQKFSSWHSIPLLKDGNLTATWIGSYKRIDVVDSTDSWGGIIGGWNSGQDIITINTKGVIKANRVFRLLLKAINIVK